MRVLLVSTYELGHQPLHVAAPAGALQRAGHDVRALDLAVEPWDADLVAWADAIAFSVPMHTAMRIAVRAAGQTRAARPDLPICFYGLYAAMGRDRTVGRLADHVIAGEYEEPLVQWIDALDGGRQGPEGSAVTISFGRARGGRRARQLLPPLDRYAHLSIGDEHRLVGSVEASHGCVHRCRHCPVPVIYDGRTRIVDVDVVLADVAQLVDLGARHVTFSDPDFLNGPHHARRVVDAFEAAFPHVTFDCTVKVEHILRHESVWPSLSAAGCIFVVSAFETTSDAVLRRLDKGHTRADMARAVAVLREAGIEPRPSFLPFTPWTTLADLADLVAFIDDHDLADNVDPVQLTIRLLLPEGSLLLDDPDLAPLLDGYDEERLTYLWRAADPEVDALQSRLATMAEDGLGLDDGPRQVFERLADEIVRTAGGPPRRRAALAGAGSARAPRLTEPWFC